ncbi:conserved hypothetical protein [Burkholderia pseudomallei 576]|nr:conserved hypothetical protein [Burkholderia pseudomallei 576]
MPYAITSRVPDQIRRPPRGGLRAGEAACAKESEECGEKGSTFIAVSPESMRRA